MKVKTVIKFESGKIEKGKRKYKNNKPVSVRFLQDLALNEYDFYSTSPQFLNELIDSIEVHVKGSSQPLIFLRSWLRDNIDKW